MVLPCLNEKRVWSGGIFLTDTLILPPSLSSLLPLLATILPLIPFNAQCTTISVSLYHSHRGKHEITRDENQGNPFELITPESITLFATDYNIIIRQHSRISLAYKDGQLLDRQNCSCLHHKSLMRLQVVKAVQGGVKWSRLKILRYFLWRWKHCLETVSQCNDPSLEKAEWRSWSSSMYQKLQIGRANFSGVGNLGLKFDCF